MTSSPESPYRHSWGLAIATYNRRDALLKTVEFALRQTPHPSEIVICDSSADASVTELAVRQLVDALLPGTRVEYVHSSAAQQTIQRNVAIRAATADVLFMIDDDAYMLGTCAERVMSVYDQDLHKQISAVAPGLMQSWSGPEIAADAPDVATPVRQASLRQRLARGLIQLYFVWTTPGKQPVPRPMPRSFSEPVESITGIGGCRITVRRLVALATLFDENLVTGHWEDYDASSRFLKHGANLDVRAPLLFHVADARPAGQGRASPFGRYGWHSNSAYLSRRLYGGGPLVRVNAFANLARYMAFDFCVGIRRRDFGKFRGGLLRFQQ